MPYSLGVLLRAGFCFSILVVSLAGCSTLQGTREQALWDYVARDYDVEAARRVDNWLSLRKRLQYQSALSEVEKVRLTNDFFNALPWRADSDNWGWEDYWATPLETLLNGSGDCEDLSIAKYFTLLAAGIDRDRLRLTYAWQLPIQQAHMVLAYLPADGGEALILDNLNKSALTLAERDDLEAVYSFNEEKLWLADEPERPLKIASQERLQKWRTVNQRISAQVQQQSWLL